MSKVTSRSAPDAKKRNTRTQLHLTHRTTPSTQEFHSLIHSFLVLLCCDSATEQPHRALETPHGVPQEVFWFLCCVREGRLLPSLLSSFRPSTSRYVERHLSAFLGGVSGRGLLPRPNVAGGVSPT